MPEPPLDPEARAAVAAQATAARYECHGRDADSDRAVEREPPRERDEPVGVGGEDEEDDAADAAECKAGRGGDVAVAGGERARCE
jgi:hypothetical protein